MKISIRSVIGIILGVLVCVAYVRLNAPVGWFDSVVGLSLAVVVFVVVKAFKGFKK